MWNIIFVSAVRVALYYGHTSPQYVLTMTVYNPGLLAQSPHYLLQDLVEV
jgi:hypothetical protein